MAATHELGTVPPLANDNSDDELLTATETARFLKVPVTWVYEHVRPESEDRLPAVKLGKYLRFHRRDLQAYIDGKRAAAQTRRRHVDPGALSGYRGGTRKQGEPILLEVGDGSSQIPDRLFIEARQAQEDLGDPLARRCLAG